MRPSRPAGGKRPTLPQVLAVTLLYGQVPGIRRLGGGKLLVTFAELGRHLSATTTDLKARLMLLLAWGVLKDLDIDRSTAIVWLATPLGFGQGDRV